MKNNDYDLTKNKNEIEITNKISKPKRALYKSLSWRVTASLATISIIYFLTGKLVLAASIVGMETISKFAFYYIHEYLWSLVNRIEKGSKLRSIFKTITWRFIASLDTLLLVYIFTGKTETASFAASYEIAIKTTLFYIHERIWDNFR